MAADEAGARRRHGALHRGHGQLRVAQHVGRPAQAGDHARETLGRGAAGQRALGGRACGGARRRYRPPRLQQLGGTAPASARAAARSRRRAALAAQQRQHLLHFQRIAGRAPEHAAHVGEQGHAPAGPRRAPCAPGWPPVRAPAPASARRRRCRTLTSSTSACSPAASFLLRMLAVISGTLSTVAVTSRIAYSRRSAGARSAEAPTMAQPASRSVASSVSRRRLHGVAGQRLQLVQRAAGVAQAAAADHRHHAAAGRDDGRQQQAHLVADATGGVLVEHRAVQAGVGASRAPCPNGSSPRSAPPSRRCPCRAAGWPWPCAATWPSLQLPLRRGPARRRRSAPASAHRRRAWCG